LTALHYASWRVGCYFGVHTDRIKTFVTSLHCGKNASESRLTQLTVAYGESAAAIIMEYGFSRHIGSSGSAGFAYANRLWFVLYRLFLQPGCAIYGYRQGARVVISLNKRSHRAASDHYTSNADQRRSCRQLVILRRSGSSLSSECNSEGRVHLKHRLHDDRRCCGREH
jgi:hypothetical protein